MTYYSEPKESTNDEEVNDEESEIDKRNQIYTESLLFWRKFQENFRKNFKKILVKNLQ